VAACCQIPILSVMITLGASAKMSQVDSARSDDPPPEP
jgi:hypothetical protein